MQRSLDDYGFDGESAMTGPRHEAFCQRLCEEHELCERDFSKPFPAMRGKPAAMSALSEAVEIVLERAAKQSHEDAAEHSTGNTGEWCACCRSIRNFVLTAEDARKV